MYFNNAEARNVGLFGYVDKSGTVQNVGVVNSYLNACMYVGAVVGVSRGTVTGCYNTGDVSGNSNVGGVAGCNFGTVANVESKTTAQFASGEVAYLLGKAWDQTIGTEDYPVMGGRTVYQVLNCAEETAYSNLNQNLDHNYADGSCTICGEQEAGSAEILATGWNIERPWAAYVDQITSVMIEESVTAVGYGAFKDMTVLKSVTLPASGLKTIGEAAFYGYASLKAIDIPDTVYTVFDYTLKNCTALVARWRWVNSAMCTSG